ncbi:hypothetical protein BH10ACI3_BH10ACI3_02340 [soil metagenome]
MAIGRTDTVLSGKSEKTHGARDKADGNDLQAKPPIVSDSIGHIYDLGSIERSLYGVKLSFVPCKTVQFRRLRSICVYYCVKVVYNGVGLPR